MPAPSTEHAATLAVDISVFPPKSFPSFYRQIAAGEHEGKPVVISLAVSLGCLYVTYEGRIACLTMESIVNALGPAACEIIAKEIAQPTTNEQS